MINRNIDNQESLKIIQTYGIITQIYYSKTFGDKNQQVQLKIRCLKKKCNCKNLINKDLNVVANSDKVMLLKKYQVNQCVFVAGNILDESESGIRIKARKIKPVNKLRIKNGTN